MNIKLLIVGLLTATSLSAAAADALSPTIPAPTPPDILAKAANASSDELKKKSIEAGTNVRVKEKSYQDAALNTDNQKAATEALDALMASWKTLIMGSAPLAIKGANLDDIIKAAKANGNNFTKANLDAFIAAYEAYSKELAAQGLDQFQVSTGRAEYDAAIKLAKAIQEELAAQKVAVEPAAAASLSATPAASAGVGATSTPATSATKAIQEELAAQKVAVEPAAAASLSATPAASAGVGATSTPATSATPAGNPTPSAPAAAKSAAASAPSATPAASAAAAKKPATASAPSAKSAAGGSTGRKK